MSAFQETVSPLTVLAEPVDVIIRNEDSRRQFQAEWARCRRHEGDPQSAGRLLALDSSLPLPAAISERLVHRITEHGINLLAGRALLLHAAGVSTSSGEVLGLVGESGAGKSTAASVLCSRGFGYVTDETLAVLADDSVVPFPKPLALRIAGREDKVHVSPDSLHLGRHPDLPLRLERIALLARDPWHQGEPTHEMVPFAQAMLALIEHTSAFVQLATPLTTLAAVVAHTSPVRIRYREAGDLVSLLTDLLDARLSAPTDGPVRTGYGATTDSSASGQQWSAVNLSASAHWSAVADAVRVGPEIVLLVANQPLVLSGDAALLWEQAGRTSLTTVRRTADGHRSRLLDELESLRALVPAPFE